MHEGLSVFGVKTNDTLVLADVEVRVMEVGANVPQAAVGVRVMLVPEIGGIDVSEMATVCGWRMYIGVTSVGVEMVSSGSTSTAREAGSEYAMPPSGAVRVRRTREPATAPVRLKLSDVVEPPTAKKEGDTVTPLDDVAIDKFNGSAGARLNVIRPLLFVMPT